MGRFLAPLLWKSWCIRKRHYIYTILELGLPVGLFYLLIYMKTSLPDNHNSVLVDNTTYPPISKEDIIEYPQRNNYDHLVIAFTPINDDTKGIINSVYKTLIASHYTVDLVQSENENEMRQFFFNNYGNGTFHSLVYGVIFHSKFSYSLRPVSKSLSTDSIFPIFASPGPAISFWSYFNQGYLLLQILINDEIFQSNKLNGVGKNPLNFSLTEFPYPSYYNVENFKSMFTMLIPLLTIFGYYVISPNLISNVIQEKNSGSREWIGMVGISKMMVLFGWVLHSMIIYFFTTLANSIILKVNIDGSPILTSTNFFVVWILLFLFCTSSIIFLMAATSFINNPNVAVICASILWILPPVAVSNYQNAKNLGFVTKLFTCFFPSVNLNWAFTAISGYEANHESITFANLFKMNNGNVTDISLGLSFVFMVIDITLYCILYLYIDSVKPGRFGRARPWYFPFKPLLKLFHSKNGDDHPVGNRKTQVNFEEVKDGLVGLSLQGIKKHFGSVVAVEDVTIDVYKGQITALLGHNGAGKTTLINIITGMFSPTYGRICKNGSNVFEDFKKFQANLGLCPQHDLLFPYLNVYEHVMFFGMLRGLSAKKASEDAAELLSFFGISDKKFSLTKQLSGGMKRKLSLTIALIGNPEIIILDEPTSGMDPESRRETWNKLLFIRENRTIILTTHYMEEADVLGDMIAIMDHGVIKCYGTSLYLKKQYGSGYKVTVPCGDHEDINKVVQSFIPENVVSTHTGSTVSYCLPLEKTNVFGDLFLALEDKLHGSRISVACTTMDDVFLKVAHGGADEVDNIPINGDDEMLLQESYKNDDMHSSSEALTPKPITGLALFIKRLSALFMKKILYNYHRWSSWLFLTVLYPFIILLIPLLLTSTIFNGEFTDPSLAMELNMYGNTKVLLSFSNSGNSLVDSFINLVKEQGSSVHQLQDSMTVEQALLDVGAENLVEYRYSYIVSANLSARVPNIFFSSIGTHSAPIAVDLLYNAFCHNCTSQIITYNHPFNFHEDICDTPSTTIAAVLPMIWLFTVPTVLAVVSYSLGRLHHDERLSCGKLLQLMTGTSPILYWVSAFLCDFILFFFSSLLILLYVFIFDSAKLFSSLSDYGIMLLVFLLSCTSSTWLGYFMSYFLRTFSRLFSFNVFLTLILGEVTYFILQVLHLGNPTALDTFHNIFLIYPSYCSSSLIYKVIKYFSENALIMKCHLPIDPAMMKNALFTWKDDGINKELVFLVCDAMIYAFLIFLTDYGIIGKIWNYIFNLYAGNIDRSNTISDADVDNEKIRVEQEFMAIKGTSSNVIVHRLGKKYSRRLTAVRDVSFLVSKGECFGLLGVNGAGKSTTFKMLTGDLMPTSGVAYIFGDNLKDNKLRYQSHIGYCPQSDAIIEDLTGYEMLSLYASLRGVNPSIRNQTISYWISQFGLQTVCNRKCETYSGGNKRKLSTAISLIGDPQIIFLDEPTTGVDPVARRKFWAVLSKLQKKGSTIILTSHSMDECETVCNRLTIMVRGEMKCIGTIERLKDIYGQGFTIIIQLRQHSKEDLENLKSKFIESFYPHAVLRDEHTGLLHYHINCPDYKWSKLFSKMESLKACYDIVKEYLITETTLEQIFLYFAKT